MKPEVVSQSGSTLQDVDVNMILEVVSQSESTLHDVELNGIPKVAFLIFQDAIL